MKTIRWGMIGCGDVAEVKSGPGFYKADNSTLVAVMRRNGAMAEDFAKRHKVPRWHDDAEAIINADDIDAVYIATLTDSHLDYAVALRQGGQAGLCRKADGDGLRAMPHHDRCARKPRKCRSGSAITGARCRAS